MRFKPGDFATLEGQVVKILSIYPHLSNFSINSEAPLSTSVRIKLLNCNLTHWVDIADLKHLPNQKIPKILYDKVSK